MLSSSFHFYRGKLTAVALLTSVTALLFAFPVMPARAALLAKYTFDDGTAADVSGNGLHGTLHGVAAIVVDDTRGMVLELGGPNAQLDTAHVSIADPTGLLNFGEGGPNQGSATVAAWVYSDDFINHDPIFNQGEWREGIGLNIKGDTDPADQLWAGRAGPNEALRSDIGVPTGVWTHVAGTWDYDGTNTTVAFYINGEPTGFAEGTGVLTGRVAAPDNNGGASDGSRLGAEWRDGNLANVRWPFNGRMDDVEIHDVALDQAGILQLMIPGVPGDVNDDEIVDINDFNIIRDNFQQPGVREEGDLSGDGFVNLIDFRRWKTANYAPMEGAAAGLGGDAVPEPGSVVLALLAVAGLLMRRAPLGR